VASADAAPALLLRAGCLMLAGFLADAVVVLHLLFILFGLFGALLALRHLGWLVLHLPAAVWICLIEFKGWLCPLTPLENNLRQAAGEAGYGGGFVEHYLLPLIYPAGLTPSIQLWLGFAALAINLLCYGVVVSRWRQSTKKT
jgi:hypothetical protein